MLGAHDERDRMTDIHPTALLEGDVELGQDVTVGPYSVLLGPLVVGDRASIGAHCKIGGYGDLLAVRGPSEPSGRVEIGAGAVIREFVSVHHPSHTPATVIGAGAYMMHGSYAAHDSLVGDAATLAQNASIGGLSRILEGAYVAMGAAVVQRVVVGPYAIVAAASAATRHVRPFSRALPNRAPDLNVYAVERFGFSEHREALAAYVAGGHPPADGRIEALIAAFDDEAERSALSA